MSTLRLQMFEDLAPELAPVDITDLDAADTARVLRFFGYAEKEEAEQPWGDLYDVVIVLLAAHDLTLRERRKKARAGGSIPVGPLTGKKTGDLSESYGAGSGSSSAREDSLRSTSYGAKYLELQKKQITGPLIT